MNPNIPLEPEPKVRQRMPKLNQEVLEKMKNVCRTIIAIELTVSVV